MVIVTSNLSTFTPQKLESELSEHQDLLRAVAETARQVAPPGGSEAERSARDMASGWRELSLQLAEKQAQLRDALDAGRSEVGGGRGGTGGRGSSRSHTQFGIILAGASIRCSNGAHRLQCRILLCSIIYISRHMQHHNLLPAYTFS